MTSQAQRLGALKSLGRAALGLLVSLAVVLLLWVALLKLFNISPFVGKGPLDVFNFLFTVPASAGNRLAVLQNLGQTMIDASLGFAAGMVGAAVVAGVFVLFRGVENALMPIAMLLRSVPLVALAPIIILIFGRQEPAVAAIGGIVVLFPALVTIVFGLRSASPAMLEVVDVYGGSRWAALKKVALPSSLPAFFTAVKVSVPGAVTGALLAEWLATGKGIGYAIISAVSRARNNEAWAAVLVITLVSIILYAIVATLEDVMLRRSGQAPSTSA
ncbi:ABC transporter permease subunit [Arthrobacter sp. NicSoilB8]|uniref:ABC transporter permease n=1 Tax=Arthrobacter sp. NicSoilB8 TaxID=2830998 RepID=UPI001CC6BEBA|nr:ABC transporter permease subunit [Arthrobacter sp. NicSoilB8]BCW68985.1 nitrate ABC transporter permease [Arthrobacter sp. NicSoilB8]